MTTAGMVRRKMWSVPDTVLFAVSRPVPDNAANDNERTAAGNIYRYEGDMTKIWLLIFAVVFVWSGIQPADVFTWVLEVSPAVIGLVVLLATRRTFPLTGLVYWLILLHCIVLMVGGHYTYAEVPLFDWFQDALGLQRNNYDKVGHFVQGFVPALVARELLIRKAVVRGRGWLNFVVLCFCLALSAFYELIEWAVALAVGVSAEAFLGTQGYSWDTQSDMAYALAGAVLALLLLGRYHDRQLENSGFTGRTDHARGK
jgi:putative membrane protein